MAGKEANKMYLRPRIRRVVPLMDVGMAIILGTVSGIYIFNDTFKRFQDSETDASDLQEHEDKSRPF